MTIRVCGAFRRGVIFIALFGVLLSMGRSIFAANTGDVEWVVVQGIACVDANSDAACSPDEATVPKVTVRSDGTVLATTDARGRFSVRVVAQSVIEFELPTGYESATGELSTQVFESGKLDVPLTQQVVATATQVVPTATAIQPTATTRAKATATVAATATKQNTPTPAPTEIPPTATAIVIPPTEASATETPAPQATPTHEAIATALPLPTETATTSVAMVLASKSTELPPTAQPTTGATPIIPLPSFEEQAQSASQSAPLFSLGAIPQVYFVSGGFLLGLGLLIGLFVYRSNALKTHSLATAPAAGGYSAGAQSVVWEQGSSQQLPLSPPMPSGREWHPIAQRLMSLAHLKSISIDAEAGILAASTVPAPVFVLGGVDGYRLVFTIDPSLPVRSGLVADRSQVARVAKFTGPSRGEAHSLWRQVAQSRNLANSACPTWADWYLLVCQRIKQAN
jgi:hypothetical protein